jgi:DNA-binding NarL/FixJ family response regulator
MTKPRLMVVADDPVSASTLRGAFGAPGVFEVMKGYTDGRGPCAATTRAYRPDVIVIDQLASRAVLLARLAELRTAAIDAKLILLTERMDRPLLAEATAAGLDAAILKSFRPEGLCALVREIVAGNVYHSFQASLAPRRHTKVWPLTDRELQILRLVAAGAPNSHIAARLWITEQTVKFHLSNVYRKLGVSNRTEASHHAHVYGLLHPESSSGVAA